MNKMKMHYALGLGALFQLLIIVGMFIYAAIPSWVGKEVSVVTRPVDPRSLFRGNYARLNYDFDRISEANLRGEKPRRGDTIYLSLKEDVDGLYVPAYASMDKPKDGVFLRGRVSNSHYPLEINFGIEAFFAPKKEALALEKDLGNGGVAVLKVSPWGQAVLETVKANDKRPANVDLNPAPEIVW